MIPIDLPFHFKILQFPIKLSFAITINKSQGQIFQQIGIDFRSQCFSHGHFALDSLELVFQSLNIFYCCKIKHICKILFTQRYYNFDIKMTWSHLHLGCSLDEGDFNNIYKSYIQKKFIAVISEKRGLQYLRNNAAAISYL